MIAIVMAYHNRQIQLNRTLESFTESSYKDFNVIIVDDCSPEDIILPELPFKVTVIKLTNKTWHDAGPVFNIGFNHALRNKSDKIIIHNPECYHIGDILSYVNVHLTDENYISFGCFKLNKETTISQYDIFDLIRENNVIAQCSEKGEWKQKCAWVNHSIIDPVAFHYCAAISARNLIKINGFDERFSFGISFNDDYLVRQIKNLGLRIEIIDNPFVVHQWHDSVQTIQQQPDLWKVNEKILYELIPLNEFRAKHILTSDLNG